MPFTLAEQARLGELYAPILFLSRNDVAPISPAEYVRRSALWSFPGPLQDPFGAEADKQSWGAPTAALMPGMLAASADDPDIDERTLIWTHIGDDPGPAWFLDHGGWDDQDRTPTEPLPATGEATPATGNLMGSVGAAIGRWSHRDAHPPLDPHIGWYSVQAFDTVSDLQLLRDKLALQEDPAADHVMEVISRLPHRCWLVFYHLFFPACSELVRECELIHTLHALGIDVTAAKLNATESAFPTSELTDLGFPYSLQWAGRLGQFVSIAVVVPVPTSPAGNVFSPLDVPDDQFLQPLFVGFGRSAPAVEPSPTGPPVEVPLMAIASAEDALFDGNHVRVFVSEANHNTYPQPGMFARPTNDTRVSICDWAGSFPEADGEPVGEPSPSLPPRQKKIAAMLKFLTLGLFGALIAAMVESARGGAGPDVLPPAAPPELGPGEPQDAAEADPEGLILAPADIVDTLLEEAAVVRPWPGTPEQRIFDERWETVDLSWGPPALQDPFRRRQGRPMPRYIGPFISALGRHLEESG